MDIPELGVGIIYFPKFKQVIESNLDLIQLIEIEPQTFWLKNRSKLDSFNFNDEEIGYLKSIDKPKLFHGVGYPVAGSKPIDQTHIPFLKRMMTLLDPVWLSEHLSFNYVELEKKLCNTNFLLPPLQTKEGIETASRAIQEYASNFELPFAFETGVNYLSQYNFEIEDGKFINAVAEEANANILLDIHNLLANEKNGRQRVRDFIKQINPNKIIQIHIAGGFSYEGYYLDAHSGISSDELFTLLEEIVRSLPNLKAITFEMLPEYLDFVTASDIRKQLKKMNSIWDKRGKELSQNHKSYNPPFDTKDYLIPSVEEWETIIARKALKKEIHFETPLSKLIDNDPGIKIIQSLIEKFRSSLIVSSLKLTCRYILIKKGSDELKNLFRGFWKISTPQLFASDNGLLFAKYLSENYEEYNRDPVFKDLLIYEYNSLKSVLDNKSRDITTSFNPEEIVDYLSKGKLPKDLTPGSYLISIVPDEAIEESLSSVYHT